MDGILIVNKPIGYTSRDVVNKIMKIFHTKKVGHTGTLDPFASGVLIITINRGTKISNFIEALDKSYIGELKLGVNTDTLDLEGEVIEEKEVALPLDKNKIIEVMNKYVGDIKQIPPMYSAIKIDGEALYKKARRGEVVERKERDVHISSIQLLSVVNEKILFQVDCSKGTYIRTLGNDIGNDLGYGGHLTMLTRVRVGKYTIKQAKNIEDLTEEDIIPINDALSYLPTKTVSGDLEKMTRNGVSLYLGMKDELVYIKNKNDEPIAVYKLEQDGKHHSLRGLC